jgi:hypothetical protein
MCDTFDEADVIVRAFWRRAERSVSDPRTLEPWNPGTL